MISQDDHTEVIKGPPVLIFKENQKNQAKTKNKEQKSTQQLVTY
jgi:hypothetical protein